MGMQIETETAVGISYCLNGSIYGEKVMYQSIPPGQSQAFDTHMVSYQNVTKHRIVLGKKADWLICQGQQKIEEGCKGMFLILYISSLLIKPELHSEMGSY